MRQPLRLTFDVRRLLHFMSHVRQLVHVPLSSWHACVPFTVHLPQLFLEGICDRESRIRAASLSIQLNERVDLESETYLDGLQEILWSRSPFRRKEANHTVVHCEVDARRLVGEMLMSKHARWLLESEDVDGGDDDGQACDQEEELLIVRVLRRQDL